MPTKEALLEMRPKQVYGEAVRAGIEVAVKRSSLGIDPEALAEWYEEHPEFADADVSALLTAGSAESLREILEMARDIPGVVGVLNATGSDHEWFPLK